MENELTTIYLPYEDYLNACKGELRRVLVGWNVPSLKSIVVVTSYSSSQLYTLNWALRELSKAPYMQNTFHRHGHLSVLDISLHRGGDQVVLKSSFSNDSNVQLVRYRRNDFKVVSYDELYTVLKNKYKHSNAGDNGEQDESNICSYFIVGCALVECLDDMIYNTLTTTGRLRKSDPGTRHSVADNHNYSYFKFKNMLYTAIVQAVVYLSVTAQSILSGCMKLYHPRLRRFIHHLTVVTLLHTKLSQIAEWDKLYKLMEHQTDMIEYVRLKHQVRQSVWSVSIDAVFGIIEFLFFRHLIIYGVNVLRLYSRALYISGVRYVSYNFAMRIGKYCKLNDEVAVFLSRLIISMLMVWRTIIPKLEQNFYLLTKLFEYAALFGVTYQMAILLDIVSVETLHTTYAHCILLYITKWMQRYKFSLLQLFKGKKWNELKQALDSNEYTREQLFLGTVIFTLILLIYPTIWVFYCITLVVYLPVFFMRAVVKCLIQVMTKIPFYYLIYNLIFPSSYKESIYFAHKFCWDKSKKVIEGTEERTTKNSNTIVLKDSHEFEIECPPFSTSTLLQPLIHTIKSCKGYLYFWRVI